MDLASISGEEEERIMEHSGTLREDSGNTQAHVPRTLRCKDTALALFLFEITTATDYKIVYNIFKFPLELQILASVRAT
jgi:hypothetical protein